MTNFGNFFKFAKFEFSIYGPWPTRQTHLVFRCYREKFRKFVAWAEPDPKTAFYRVFMGTL